MTEFFAPHADVTLRQRRLPSAMFGSGTPANRLCIRTLGNHSSPHRAPIRAADQRVFHVKQALSSGGYRWRTSKSGSHMGQSVRIDEAIYGCRDLEYRSPETLSPEGARCAPPLFNTIQCFTWNTGHQWTVVVNLAVLDASWPSAVRTSFRCSVGD